MSPFQLVAEEAKAERGLRFPGGVFGVLLNAKTYGDLLHWFSFPRWGQEAGSGRKQL